jgi:glycolate oxidase FAD binding subunit
VAGVSEPVRTALAAIIGEAQLSTERSVCEALAVDGRVPGCVVYPGSAEQVARTLKCAADSGLAVVAVGSATKLGIGNPPRKYDIALCTQNITNVRYYEASDLTAGVGAGMKLRDLQNLFNSDGLWLPLDPAGNGQSTIGGIVAANASGPLRHFYGAPRDMVVGMQVATTEGKLIRTGGRVVKNVAGYDLGKLLIGSYGTLGVITEVNLKLFPLPAERKTFVLSTGTLGVARDLRRSILASPIEPLRMVLLDGETGGIVTRGAQPERMSNEPQIWLEAGGSKSVVDRIWRELSALGQAVGARVHTHEEEDTAGAWQAISDFAGRIVDTYPGSVVLKGTMPIANSEKFLSLVQQEAQNEKVRMASVAQPGIGIIHLGLLDQQNPSQAAGLIGRIRKAAEKSDGALAVISAPAELKEQVDAWGAAGTGFELMRKLKAAWDPQGILAPGRFVGGV